MHEEPGSPTSHHLANDLDRAERALVALAKRAFPICVLAATRVSELGHADLTRCVARGIVAPRPSRSSKVFSVSASLIVTDGPIPTVDDTTPPARSPQSRNPGRARGLSPSTPGIANPGRSVRLGAPGDGSSSGVPRRVEVAGALQLEVVGADHCPERSPSRAWATSSTSAAIERRDREHGARELYERASAGERSRLPPPLAELPERLGDGAGEHRAACSKPGRAGQRRRGRRDRRRAAPPRRPGRDLRRRSARHRARRRFRRAIANSMRPRALSSRKS
jgi:hypothetical protein